MSKEKDHSGKQGRNGKFDLSVEGLPDETQLPEVFSRESMNLGHDGYFLEAFQEKRIALTFLKKVLPEKTLGHIELDNLTIEQRQLTDDLFKTTIADIFYKVPIRNTKKHVNFLVLIEHKSYDNPLTIFQLWGYVYGVCRQDYLAAK